MKKIVMLAAVAVLSLGACAESIAQDTTDLDNSPAPSEIQATVDSQTIVLSNGAKIITFCDHGNRVYVTYSDVYGGYNGALTAVPGEATCAVVSQ